MSSRRERSRSLATRAADAGSSIRLVKLNPLSSAVARLPNEPLLFVGKDFAATDLPFA